MDIVAVPVGSDDRIGNLRDMGPRGVGGVVVVDGGGGQPGPQGVEKDDHGAGHVFKELRNRQARATIVIRALWEYNNNE